ncbi:MAG: ATP-binding protein [Muribaculaceae bacterium]|nr:ATP-binding protein [Muribaculaceae bacterium]
MSEIRYPIGDSSFTTIRSEGQFYVDKTGYIFRMVKQSKYNFLSRPRRFGKSLLISTMEAYFMGKKELFKGLEIEKLEKEWNEYPVFRLDFSVGNMSAPSNLREYLNNMLSRWEESYSVPTKTYYSFGIRFNSLLESVFYSTGKKIVVLVDEYDNPLFSTYENTDVHEEMRSILKDIYSVLKASGDYIHFCFLTGITRFSKMSIFSGLNNLRDLTLIPAFSGICGITQNELENVCKGGIETVAETNGTDFSGALSMLKENYDGYHFGDMDVDVYNPFSLIQSFPDGIIDSYWFASGTSEFLWKRIINLSDTESLINILSPLIRKADLAATEKDGLLLEALLFQTGYLTLKEKLDDGKVYRLGVPNLEVRDGIYNGLLPAISRKSQQAVTADILVLRKLANEGNPEAMMNFIQSFLAGISYQVTKKMPEIYYENNILMLFSLIGIRVTAEKDTSDGRIDITVETSDYIYILEFKLDRSAETALAQIEDKKYWLQFRRLEKPLFLIGVNFSSKERNITSWNIKPV